MSRMRYRHQTRARQSGAAAVEFGLIAIPLLLLLFGIIQYGFFFWSMQAGSAAARDAARHSAVGTLDCDRLEPYVEDHIGPAGRDEDGDNRPDVTVERTTQPAAVEPDDEATEEEDSPDADAVIGDTVVITIRFKSPVSLGLVPLPDDAQVHESASSRVENVTGDLVCIP